MSSDRSPPSFPLGSAIVIAAIVGSMAAAFAYTGGWLSPGRLSGNQMADAFGPKVVPGHRVNHAKGICFIGSFRATGAGSTLSRAPMLVAGDYPVVGRFNLGTPDPLAPDGSVRVRGIGMQITAPDGQQWRMAMIDAPMFAVSTPREFYETLKIGASKDPNAMKSFAAVHPEIAPFLAWAKSGERTGSYAEERYNSLDSFLFTNAYGHTQAVRWSILPQATARAVAADQLAKMDQNGLEHELADRVAQAPAKWTLTAQVANPGDPTGDPSKAWPTNRKVVTMGEVVVAKVIPEPNGPCRDLNFDPTVLPAGMTTSDDPFPSARSAVYAKSYDRRTAAAGNYPRDTNPYPPGALPPAHKMGGAS